MLPRVAMVTGRRGPTDRSDRHYELAIAHFRARSTIASRPGIAIPKSKATASWPRQAGSGNESAPTRSPAMYDSGPSVALSAATFHVCIFAKNAIEISIVVPNASHRQTIQIGGNRHDQLCGCILYAGLFAYWLARDQSPASGACLIFVYCNYLFLLARPQAVIPVHQDRRDGMLPDSF